VTTHVPSPTDLHDDQIIALLRNGAHGSLLAAYFGEREYRELSQLARLAATRRNPRGRLVFILPGVMGSRLASSRRDGAELIWLHPSAVGEGALASLALPGKRGIRALGVMLPGYLKLKLSLEVAGFRSVFYPFDWRLDLETLARGFMRAVQAAGKRKVLVAAHSMGGLVARAALALDKERRIERLVQIGAPNAGSFAPVQALRAAYPTVRKIAALDHTCSADELARRVFHSLPGLYQMLPSPDPGLDLFDVQAWPQDGLEPNAKMLAHARRVRERLPAADARCCVIVGTDQETVVDARRTEAGFEYEVRRAGDGTVPSARAHWPGAPTWRIAENHGALTQNDVALGALCDLLTTGDTTRLSTQAPPPATEVVRTVTDAEMRARATTKVRWDQLSLESRRRILDPVITPEFEAPIR
jgi:pimeloyl-ACP methyl ester carboxylesterase